MLSLPAYAKSYLLKNPPVFLFLLNRVVFLLLLFRTQFVAFYKMNLLTIITFSLCISIIENIVNNGNILGKRVQIGKKIHDLLSNSRIFKNQRSDCHRGNKKIGNVERLQSGGRRIFNNNLTNEGIKSKEADDLTTYIKEKYNSVVGAKECQTTNFKWHKEEVVPGLLYKYCFWKKGKNRKVEGVPSSITSCLYDH